MALLPTLVERNATRTIRRGSACDGPGWTKRTVDGVEREFFDYYARGAPNGPDDGTVAPWVVVASLVLCLSTWYVIERTKLGAYLRAATENPTVVQAFGVNVPRMITLTYGFGVGLAALAGVMAAPIYQVSPQMGANLIIVVFAVVVIGGMGSIMGSIVTGFALGLIEGLTKVFYPQASNTVIFVIMVIVLMLRPAGLFGRER